MANHASPTSRRKGLFVLLTGIAASAILALSFSPTMSAFVASITNSNDTATSGYLTMQETDSLATPTVCNSNDGAAGNVGNNATCATINKYGGSTTMFPGQTITTTVNIKNTGTVNATAFTLLPAACSQAAVGTVSGNATDLCAKINLTIKSGTISVFSGTLASFNTGGQINLTALAGIGTVAPGTSIPFTFAVQLDSASGNAYQGLKASQAMTWSFSA